MKIWDWFCFHKSQWHVRLAIQAMGRSDYEAARRYLRNAVRWEKSRPSHMTR